MYRQILLCTALLSVAAVVWSQSGDFGEPTKAQFYPVQTNPQSSEGQFVQLKDSSELVYAIPTPVFLLSDVQSTDIQPDSTGLLFNVSMRLTTAGVSKVRALIALRGSDAPVVLVWKNLVYNRLTATDLDPPTANIVVATGLEFSAASDLAAALQ